MANENLLSPAMGTPPIQVNQDDPSIDEREYLLSLPDEIDLPSFEDVEIVDETAPIEEPLVQNEPKTAIEQDALPDVADVEMVPTSLANEDFEEYTKTKVPDTLGMLGFDIQFDLEIPESMKMLKGRETTFEELTRGEAFAYTVSHQMTDVVRGIKQIAGVDEEEMKEKQKAFDLIMGDPRFDGWAPAGAVAGALLEPVGFFIPAIKSKNIVTGVAKGMGVGLGFGSAGYVDEAAGQTRLQNGLIGMAMGGTFVGVGKAVTAGAPKFTELLKKAPGTKQLVQRRSHSLLDKYEMDWAKLIADGADPQDASKALLARDPQLGPKISRAFNETGRIPHTLITQSEAEQIVNRTGSLKKPIDIALGMAADTGKAIVEGMDTIGGSLSTRIRNISEPVFGRLREYEYKIRRRPHEFITRTQFFSDSYKQLSEHTQHRVHAYMVNGEWNKARTVFKNEFGDEGELALMEVQDVLSEIGMEAQSVGRLDTLRRNYFPRYIMDKAAMRERLGKEEFQSVKDEIAAAAQKKGAALSPLEEADIINKRILRPVKPGEGRPGFTKQRGFDQVPGEFLDLYADPVEALHTYINNAVIDIEKARFFGKGYSKADGTNYVDVSNSVGGFLEKEIGKGNLTGTQVNELSHLLNIRFGIGEQGSMRSLQATKNILYSGLLGNPVSAVTQTGDVGSSIYFNGMKNTLESVGETLTGKTDYTVKDFGLVDKLSEEFASTTGTAKLLQKSLRVGGFEAVDRLGKSTIINGAFKKYSRLFDPESGLSTKARQKGIKEMEEKYRGVFGDEFDNLVGDLKMGKQSDNVRLLLFNELSDIQPISLSEMPEAYLRMPNGRVAYMFKTFIMKQFDIIRRDAYNEIVKKGNYAKGFGNLARYGAIIGSANTGAQYVKDWMMGRDDEKDIPYDVAMNLFKTLGWSEYMQKKLDKGEVVGAATDFVMPPFKIFDEVIKDPESVVQFASWGRLYHNWFMGGLEEWEERHGSKGVFGGND